MTEISENVDKITNQLNILIKETVEVRKEIKRHSFKMDCAIIFVGCGGVAVILWALLYFIGK